MSVTKFLRQASNVKPFIQNFCHSQCFNSMFDCFDLNQTSASYATQFADILLFDQVNDTILHNSKTHNFLTEETDFIQIIDSQHKRGEHMLLGSAVESLLHVFTSIELLKYYKDTVAYPLSNSMVIRPYINTNVFYDKEQDRELKTYHAKVVDSSTNLQKEFNEHTTYIQEYDIMNTVPLQAMACGCIPILVDQSETYNATILRSGDNCVIVSSTEEAMDAAEMLNNNQKLVETMKTDIKDSFDVFNLLEETKKSWEILLQ